MNDWVVLELSSKSDGEDPGLIREAIEHLVKGAEVFVPAMTTQVGEDRVIHYLVEGYAFVRRSKPDQAYMRLENSRFVNKVLTQPGVHRGDPRRLATIPSSEIERLRMQVQVEADQGISVDDKVTIISGPYRNIEATVVEDIPEEEKVQVYIELRSKRSLVTLPRSFLQITDRAPMSPLVTRLQALKVWIRLARPVLLWSLPDTTDFDEKIAQYDRIANWADTGQRLFAFMRLYWDPSFVPDPLLEKMAEIEKIDAWLHQIKLHGTPERVDDLSQRITALESLQAEVVWVEDVSDRGRALWNSVGTITRKLARQRKKTGDMQLDNVLIDGHNLAFRCLYAPGMSDLKDSKGRPTGMILGFLRSLGALKKRWPEARIVVTWDGSNQRRKAKFADYKANRNSRVETTGEGEEVWNPIKFLREYLPSVGVRQAWNPVEEADDVLAALVRGELSREKNLIFSTDRDLLQLVSGTTIVLVPAVGSRKEILFNAEAVERQYGVEPGKMVELRAMFGDTSDNIPGVPRVPKKVLKALIQAHGSAAAVFASKLAGVTKSQYERLRSAEPQVKINLELMYLQDDIDFDSVDPDVDEHRAADRLRELDIRPDPILKALLGVAVGFTEETVSV